MPLLSRITSFARNLLQKRERDNDLDNEIRSQLELLADQKIKEGLPPNEARRAAKIELGGVEQLREQVRAVRTGAWLDSLLQDIRFALRMLRKNPGFTVVAVLTLALGIGANGAIFSVVNSVLLHPLAYKNPEQLVTILHYGTSPISPANYLDYRRQSTSYEDMGAAEYWSPNLTGVQSPEHLLGLYVTQNVLPLLGIRPALGRLFVQGEDTAGNDHEVILSYGLWQRRFSGDASALGKSVVLDGISYTIVGVMPPSFHFAPFWATHAELWAPLSLEPRGQSRDGNSLRLFARLKSGVTLNQARAEMATITARLEKMYPGTNTDIVVTSLKEKVVGNIETPLLVLIGAVGFVLLIACANVAHMLLARAAARQKELAVRTALGARRSRVIRQVLTENLLLAAMAGSVGLLLAYAGTRALVALSPADIPRVETVSIDVGVIVFLLLITILTSIAFGLVPALQASRVNLTDTLKENSRGSSEGIHRNRLRNILVVSEFALALTLLIGAGLMIRSFIALESVDPGFNPHGVLSMIVPIAGSREADPGRRPIFYRQMIERVRAVPGVESAAGINHLPIAGDLWDRTFLIEGRPTPAPTDLPDAVYRVATPGYFHTMDIRLLRGRDISDADTASAPPVVVINQTMARTFWPSRNPLGQRIAFTTDKNPTWFGADNSPTWMTVIGVVKDPMLHDWTGRPYPELYVSAFQDQSFLGIAGTHADYITLAVRTAGDPAALTPSVKSAIWSLDGDLPISNVLTMDNVIAEANAQPRFEMLLLGVFAAVALALAAVGIYGVISYSVARRTHEIGIRISLGASRKDVLLLIIHQGLTLALIGSAIGLASAFMLARLMTKLLYGVAPTDPVTFAGVAALLIAVALLACYIPARRAMRIDPVSAMRCE
ncbi:MAG: ADOP family duplicated permease [Candidatus Acidiferrales bacterium]